MIVTLAVDLILWAKFCNCLTEVGLLSTSCFCLRPGELNNVNTLRTKSNRIEYRA